MAATRVGLNHIDIVGPLLPITGGFVVPFTAYFSLLSARVVLQRLKDKISLGDEDEECTESDTDPTTTTATTSTTEKDKDDKHKHHHKHHHHHHHPLMVLSRAHANFAENVPLALILAAVAELNGANRKALKVSLAGLMVARVLHAEFGLCRPGATGMGRAVGYYGTLGVMGFLAGYAGWLVKDYWLA